MRIEPVRPRGLALRLLRAVAIIVFAMWAVVCAVLLITYRSIDYPGSTVVSKGSIVRFMPSFALRHDAAYESTDTFSRVYTWYSRGFDLGTERHANGGCIQIGRTRPLLLGLRQDMTAQVCETPSGRRMYVMRAFTYRYPDWARSAMALLPR
jgi:hypothetical protein